MAGVPGFLEFWRLVQESNPCRRREREAIHYNSKKLRGIDTRLPHLKDSRELLLKFNERAQCVAVDFFWRLLKSKS